MRSVQSTLKGLLVVSSVVAVFAFGFSRDAQTSSDPNAEAFAQRDQTQRGTPRPAPRPELGQRVRIVLLYDPTETPQSQVRQIEDELNRFAPNGMLPASIEKNGQPDEQYAEFVRKLNEHWQRNPKTPVLLTATPAAPNNPCNVQGVCVCFIWGSFCLCICREYDLAVLRAIYEYGVSGITNTPDGFTGAPDSSPTGNASSASTQKNREQLIDSVARGSRLILVLVGPQFQQQARNQPWNWWEENVFRPLAENPSGRPIASLTIKNKSFPH